MNKYHDHLLHAEKLRTEILAATEVWLPRREILLDWLNGFLRRAEIKTYVLGETEAADLTALDHFLRKRKIPVVAAA
jgi:hypothetical protein